MYRGKILIALSVLALLFWTCEREVEWDTSDYEPKLVVNALFSPDSTWIVEVSESRPVTASTPAVPVEDAIVTVYDVTDAEPLAVLSYSSATSSNTSIYRSSGLKPVPGIRYQLTVEKADYALPIESTSDLPPEPTVTGYQLNTELLSNFEFRGSIDLTFDNPAGETNYYHLVLRRPQYIFENGNPTLTGYTTEEFTLSNFPGAIDFFQEGYLFTDEDFDGSSKTLTLQLNTTFNPLTEDYDHFFVELRGVSQDYYEYHRTANEQYYSPINKYVEIHSNIENGLGIFAGYQAASTKVSF